MRTRLMTAFAAGLLLFAATTAAYAEDDMQVKYNALKAKGIVSEQRLNDGVTRAELAAALMRTFLLEPTQSQSAFSDLKEHWIGRTKAAETLVELGWMTAKSDRLFGPNDKITQSEFAQIWEKSGHAADSRWAGSPRNLTRGQLISAIYEVMDDEQFKLRIIRSKVTSSSTVELTFSDRKTQAFDIPELTPGRSTMVEVTYKEQPFSFAALWMGDKVESVRLLRTKLNVRAGEVEKQKLSYQLYNAAGQRVPLPGGAKIVFSSDNPHVSADGWFDNSVNPDPVGTEVVYTVKVMQNNAELASDTEHAVVQEPEGFKPTAIRYLTGDAKLWSQNYVTMQNDGVKEPRIRMIVTKALDSDGNVIDHYKGKDEVIAEQIGELSFYSVDERIATVDENGGITPVAPGRVPLVIISGDYEFSQNIYVYPEQIPTTSVYSVKYNVKSNQSIAVKLKDQFGQPMRTAAMADRFSVRTQSGGAEAADLSNVSLSIANNQLMINGAVFNGGDETLIISYDGKDIGTVSIVREGQG
jgi:hypothetical protein